MGRPRKHSAADIASAVAATDTLSAAAKLLGTSPGNLSNRLKGEPSSLGAHPARLELQVEDGIVLVGSDAHVWPGPLTTAMRAFIYFCAELSPKAVIINGDLFDGATVSRFPSIGWETKPTLADEIHACQAVCAEIEAVSGGARRIWTLGNHDLRFETRLASTAPEFRGVEGIHLKDHFPEWESCWSTWINPGAGNSPLVIKHRFKGGQNATLNNTLYAGMSVATGHLHSLRVTPFSDYWGTRYGIDTGTLARPYSEQFVHYTEDNPVNWRAGFAVFTFRGGRMLMPELVQVWDEAGGIVQFRGELIEV